MATVEKPFTISERVNRLVGTSAGQTQAPVDPEAKRDWDAVIDRRLLEWALHPNLLDEEGLIAPSRETIRIACRIAAEMRNHGLPSPTRVVPDGDGGIVFELVVGSSLEVMHIYSESRVELLYFRDAKLCGRQRVL
jgi:hypothetical protein